MNNILRRRILFGNLREFEELFFVVGVVGVRHRRHRSPSSSLLSKSGRTLKYHFLTVLDSFVKS